MLHAQRVRATFFLLGDRLSPRYGPLLHEELRDGDWTLPGTSAIVARVLAQIRPGSIVLSHDGGGPRGQTLAAYPAIVRRSARAATASGPSRSCSACAPSIGAVGCTARKRRCPGRCPLGRSSRGRPGRQPAPSGR
jgi:hypothetical protein